MFNEKVVILIKKISLEFDKIANPILQDLNLTVAQYKIVKYLLLRQNEDTIQQDIEKFFSLTHPTTIELLEKLEEKGFVTRIKNPADGRSRIIRLTEMALSKQDELIEVGNILESKMTEGLNDAETKQLMKLLEKMLSGINKSN